MVLAAIATVALTALLINIFERKREAKNPFFRVVELNDTIDDPATWGKDFPLQYDLYLRTTDMERTKYGGSEGVPHSPTQADPRSVVARSKLQEDPRLKTIWAGYSFSADYRERRGHAYMLEDQTFTERQKFAPPAMCIDCHASMVTTYLKLGEGDIMKGFNVISDSHMTYPQIREQVKHPVACIDCHDPQTMQLRITRPAFIEGIRALKASQGIQNYDVNTMATRQEMRSFVCGQCHVTYYFQPPNKRLTYPWAKGLKVENIIATEDELKIKEWDHPDSGAGLIKARHPEFEMWNQGVHARSGVTCADCGHAIYAARRPQNQRSPDKQSSAENQSLLSDLPSFFRGGIEGESGGDSGQVLQPAEHCLGCSGRLDQRHQDREGKGRERCATCSGARVSAQGTVHDRFRDVRELNGIPRPAGGNENPWGRDQRLPTRTAQPARRSAPES